MTHFFGHLLKAKLKELDFCKIIQHARFISNSAKEIAQVFQVTITMFSSLFGKRRSSPGEDETPPIPGPKTDEGFEVLDINSSRGSLYPGVPSGSFGPGAPYPQRPAPQPPIPAFKTNTDQTFHYLQGVPFTLSKELQLASKKDSFTTETSDLLSFLTSNLNVSVYDYDFHLEKSVLKEC